MKASIIYQTIATISHFLLYHAVKTICSPVPLDGKATTPLLKGSLAPVEDFVEALMYWKPTNACKDVFITEAENVLAHFENT